MALKKQLNRKPKRKKPAKTLAQLQNEWYAKLAESGFDDIEWNKNPNSRYLKWTPKPSLEELHERGAYFRMAEAYLNDRMGLRGRDRFIWKLHAGGATYQEILDAYNAKYSEISIYTLYYKIQELLKKCKAWNERNPQGTLYIAPEDEEQV